MPQKIITKKPLFNFLDIHVSEVDKRPNATPSRRYDVI
jgi:hypothetical protein